MKKMNGSPHFLSSPSRGTSSQVSMRPPLSVRIYLLYRSCFGVDFRTILIAIILSKIVQALYAVRSGPGRHSEALRLEELLGKWFLELPDHLRFEPGSVKRGMTPPPHVLTLHMQYWCVVLLLHRPL